MAKTDAAGKRVEWMKVGSATVYDTKKDGTKRTDKNGVVYHMGQGVVDGKSVVFTVRPSRPGSLDVFVEMPPPDEAK